MCCVPSTDPPRRSARSSPGSPTRMAASFVVRSRAEDVSAAQLLFAMFCVACRGANRSSLEAETSAGCDHGFRYGIDGREVLHVRRRDRWKRLRRRTWSVGCEPVGSQVSWPGDGWGRRGGGVVFRPRRRPSAGCGAASGVATVRCVPAVHLVGSRAAHVELAKSGSKGRDQRSG